MFRLIIFDLDGTIADTSVDITNALNFALRPFGVREYSVQEVKSMVGSGITRLITSLIPEEFSDEKNKKDAIDRFTEFYSQHLLDNTVLYEGIKETLERLKGYIKVVLSNKRTGYSIEILEGLGVAGYFDKILGSDSVREKKPSPVPVLDIMNEYRVRRDETIMIGDSNYDIQAARAAGVKIIAVTYGFRKFEELESADYIIDRFSDILDIVQGGSKPV
jgi:phosphoglycolate phosphatase